MTESVVFYKYKNAAFGHCHLDLNSLNHNFSGFRYRRSCNMVQQATTRIISRERESIAENYCKRLHYVTLYCVTVALRLTLFHTCVRAMRSYISLVVN